MSEYQKRSETLELKNEWIYQISRAFTTAHIRFRISMMELPLQIVLFATEECFCVKQKAIIFTGIIPFTRLVTLDTNCTPDGIRLVNLSAYFRRNFASFVFSVPFSSYAECNGSAMADATVRQITVML